MINETIEKLEAIADVRFEDIATFDGVKVNYRPISEWSETAKLALLDTVVYADDGSIARIPAPKKIEALLELTEIYTKIPTQ
jgi:hypothetical protein